MAAATPAAMDHTAAGTGPESAHPGSAGREDWLVSFAFWDTYFAVVTAGVAALLIIGGPELPARHRAAAAVVLVALVAWYLAFGRALARAEDLTWRGVVFQLGVAALYTGGVVLVDFFSFLLFAVCPLVFMTLPFRRAVVVLVAVNLVVPIRAYAQDGDPVSVLRGPAMMALTATAFSLLFGAWVDRIVRQSEERAELIRELEATRAQVARLSHDAGVAAERQRLAGDLHDTIAQGLTSVIMLIQAADAELDRDPATARRHLALATEATRENLGEARALVAALTPTALSGSSLPEALSRLATRFERETGVAATVTVDGRPRPTDTAIDVVLLRVAQEALTNVRRHAAAASVVIRLAYRADGVRLEVRDDGRGFKGEPSGGYGLAGMRSRVEQVHGSLTVSSSPGEGTTIRVEVP